MVRENHLPWIDYVIYGIIVPVDPTRIFANERKTFWPEFPAPRLHQLNDEPATILVLDNLKNSISNI